MIATVAQPGKAIQATVMVHGRVQQVGYRKKVKNAAELVDITGFVENLKDPSATDEKHRPVRIICQGTRSAVEKFVELITIRNGYIDVQKVEVSSPEEIKARFYDFHIHRDDLIEEFNSRMDRAITILTSMDEGIHGIGEKIDRTNEKIDKGFDRTNESIANMNENLGEKMDRGTEINLRRFDRIEEKYGAVAEGLKGARGAEKGFAVEEERGEYGADGTGTPEEEEGDANGRDVGHKNEPRRHRDAENGEEYGKE